MGLFDFIGESIGNAFSNFADWISAGFDAVISGTLNNMQNFGATIISKAFVEWGGSETSLNNDVTAMVAKMQDDIHLAPEASIAQLLDYHGPAPFGFGKTALDGIFPVLLAHLSRGQIINLIVEGCSLGQIEGFGGVLALEDKTWGFSDLASKKKGMEYDAAFFLPYQKELNTKYQNQIPGSSDIVRFALRECYDPDRLPILMDPGPGIGYYNDMFALGYSQKYSDYYWGAHWVLPSVGQLNEMLHRKVINDTQHSDYLRYNDVIKEAIPWIKQISYKPYTRVDVRRMYDVGVLEEEEVLTAYKDVGYDDEHAANMTLWTKVYIAVGELRARYSKGWITKEELKQSFIDLGMKESKAITFTEKLVKAESEESAGKERDLTKTDITRSVAKGLISKEDGIARLIDLGYDEQEADLIVSAVISEAVAEEIAVDRDISKSEIIQGVKLGVISRADSVPMLVKLGYTEDEANYILDLRVLPVHTERIVKERDLTKAELVKGVKKGVITDYQAVQMLEDMGYDNDEAWYIITINVEALAGSPKTWSEFQEIINWDRAARRQKVKKIPSDIKDLEILISEKKRFKDELPEKERTEAAIISIDNQIRALQKQLDTKIKKWRE